MFVKLISAITLAVAPLPPAPGSSYGLPSADPPPPTAAVVAGGRAVSVRNDAGGLSRLTSIPSASLFATYRGGSQATCSFRASSDGFLLSNGDIVSRGTVVTSHYVFVEGWAVPFDLPPAVLPDDIVGLDNRGPLRDATRTFSVFCDRTFYDVNFAGIIAVSYGDVGFQLLPELERLRNNIQLDRPVVFDNPVVDRFGGLVTRYPAWLAIDAGSWSPQQSQTRSHRGARFRLLAYPRELEFDVEFAPNPTKPSPAFTGTLDCITSTATGTGNGIGIGNGTVEPVASNGVFPALPQLPEQTTPGVNGPCMWTPPGPGRVTITARITYTVTFWVDGYTMPDDDYTWTSTPTTYDTGELIAVNTKP